MKYLASSTNGAQAFLIFSLIMSLIGFVTYGIDLQIVGLIILGYFVYGSLGIVATFHRNLTHQSYKTHPLIVKLFSFFGSLAGTGSPIAWVAIHICHHLKSDKQDDPHSPLYQGLNVFKLDYQNGVDDEVKWRMRDLITDRYQQFLHRYYFGIIALWSVALLLIGGPYLMIFGHLAPAAVTAIMSNVVNYIGHKPNSLGSFRTHNTPDQSANNWLWAIPSWGETWHNNHHRFPRNFSCGQKWWQIDITAYVIRAIRLKG